ncbi:MAG: cupin domain-containing protein [Firmicutes bacterium]|nr:cupin domain-containing protein [Bacillota bacterium]
MSMINVFENHLGGHGKVTVERLLNEEQLNGKCGLFGKITVEAGASLGYHDHHGETETYYILSGEGVYDDNGVKIPAKAGDVFFCGDGSGHSIECIGSEPLVFMALIIKG